MSRLRFVFNFSPWILSGLECACFPRENPYSLGSSLLEGSVWTVCGLLCRFLWEFHLPHQAVYQRFLCSSLPEPDFGTHCFPHFD